MYPTIVPTVLRYGRYFEKQHWDATFESGLDALLDELERRLRKDRGRVPRRRRA